MAAALWLQLPIFHKPLHDVLRHFAYVDQVQGFLIRSFVGLAEVRNRRTAKSTGEV